MKKSFFLVTSFLGLGLALSLVGVYPTAPQVSASEVCGFSCSSDVDCATGLICFAGDCRNPWCPTAEDCVCAGGDVNVDVNVDQNQEQNQDVNVDVNNEINTTSGQVLGMQVPSVTPVTGGGADAAWAALLSLPLLRWGLKLSKFRG